MKQIQHVFFDLDRTLWDFETNSRVTLEELFAAFRLEALVQTDAEHFIREYKRINELFWNDYRDGSITKEDMRYARFEVALAFFGVDDKELAAEFGQAYIDRSPYKTSVVEGAFELLDHLRHRYGLHIITNGFREVQHIKLSESGLLPYFDQIVISELVGYRKPSVEVFRFAENAAGSTPENSIMIGDHYEADILGALNAGWKAVLLGPDVDRAESSRNFTHISSLSELKAIL